MNKLSLIIILICATSVFCQKDTLDSVVLSNGETIKCKVISIKNDVVEFVELSTSISYEYEKSKIDLIILSSGQIINFKTQEKNFAKENWEQVENETDSDVAQLAMGGGVLLAFKSDNYNKGTGADLFIELRTASVFSVRANFGYYTADTKVDYLSKGNASFYLMELSLFLRAFRGIVQPYAGLGIGYYIVENTLDNQIVNYFRTYGYGVKEEIEAGESFHIKGGLDLILSSNFGLNMDLKYTFYNT